MKRILIAFSILFSVFIFNTNQYVENITISLMQDYELDENNRPILPPSDTNENNVPLNTTFNLSEVVVGVANNFVDINIKCGTDSNITYNFINDGAFLVAETSQYEFTWYWVCNGYRSRKIGANNPMNSFIRNMFRIVDNLTYAITFDTTNITKIEIVGDIPPTEVDDFYTSDCIDVGNFECIFDDTKVLKNYEEFDMYFDRVGKTGIEYSNYFDLIFVDDNIVRFGSDISTTIFNNFLYGNDNGVNHYKIHTYHNNMIYYVWKIDLINVYDKVAGNEWDKYPPNLDYDEPIVDTNFNSSYCLNVNNFECEYVHTYKLANYLEFSMYFDRSAVNGIEYKNYFDLVFFDGNIVRFESEKSKIIFNKFLYGADNGVDIYNVKTYLYNSIYYVFDLEFYDVYDKNANNTINKYPPSIDFDEPLPPAYDKNVIEMIVDLLAGFFSPLTSMWESMFKVELTSFWLFDSLGDLFIKLVVFGIVLSFVYALWKGGADD